MLGVHTYHNRDHVFGGIEVARKGLMAGQGMRPMELDLRGMLWMQPKDGGFYDEEGKPGALVTVRALLPLGEFSKAYVEAEGKTEGWVMANPYLDQNVSMRFGLAWDLRK